MTLFKTKTLQEHCQSTISAMYENCNFFAFFYYRMVPLSTEIILITAVLFTLFLL